MAAPTTEDTVAPETSVTGPVKAYVVERYKSPMKAGEAPQPIVGDRDVLVEIAAAGVNLLDARSAMVSSSSSSHTRLRSSSGTTSPAL